MIQEFSSKVPGKVLDELVKEGVIERDSAFYQYKGLTWNVGQRDIFDPDVYHIFEYNDSFFNHAKLTGTIDIIDVDPKYDTGEYMVFKSHRATKNYIRKTFKRFMDKIIELKNKETEKALDVLA